MTISKEHKPMNSALFLDFNNYSSLPRPGPRPVPPHSLVLYCPTAAIRGWLDNNFTAHDPNRARERSERIGIGAAPRMVIRHPSRSGVRARLGAILNQSKGRCHDA
jgi:hypothetical protein